MMPRTVSKKMSSQPKQKAGAPIKHKTPKKQTNSKISGKSSSSQRKIVPISKEEKEEEDESIRPITVRSLERKEAKKEQKKKKRIGKIDKLDRKKLAFAKS